MRGKAILISLNSLNEHPIDENIVEYTLMLMDLIFDISDCRVNNEPQPIDIRPPRRISYQYECVSV